jgi:hypothetical protein
LILKEGNLFERVLTNKNDSCKETNRLDSSTCINDCYDAYWVSLGTKNRCGVFTEDMNERRISGVSEPHRRVMRLVGRALKRCF